MEGARGEGESGTEGGQGDGGWKKRSFKDRGGKEADEADEANEAGEADEVDGVGGAEVV